MRTIERTGWTAPPVENAASVRSMSGIRSSQRSSDRTAASSSSRAMPLEVLVVRSAAAFGRHPVDDLVGVGDVAGLAVHAVRGVDVEAQLVGPARGVGHHLV